MYPTLHSFQACFGCHPPGAPHLQHVAMHLAPGPSPSQTTPSRPAPPSPNPPRRPSEALRRLGEERLSALGAIVLLRLHALHLARSPDLGHPGGTTTVGVTTGPSGGSLEAHVTSPSLDWSGMEPFCGMEPVPRMRGLVRARPTDSWVQSSHVGGKEVAGLPTRVSWAAHAEPTRRPSSFRAKGRGK